ncbi:hypothetical protein [Pedobacter endophyticus]|uniref:Fasciclin domain-containing protein n=1 Tax=Pedobacter endophyticus TaxID=2789740 RepID=A0A7U3Q5A8_9SPHI|nr:hypothetical protein [Pedobacter endophyticus]QPH38880.1 hypothetical protein IZT61_17705 [Pedobacter endophyticus]
MINRNRKLMAWPIVVVALLGTTFTACKKNSEYYAYENTVKEFDGTVLQYLQAQPANTFDSLLLVLNRLPEIKDSLENSNITLFAPTNASFEAAIKNLNILRKDQGKTPLYLTDCNLDSLELMTWRYVIRGSRTTDAYVPFADGALFISLKNSYPMHIKYNKLNASGFVQGGPQSIIYSDPKNSIFEKYWQRANTNAVNIKAKNGVINILAPLHDYGFNEFVSRVNQ